MVLLITWPEEAISSGRTTMYYFRVVEIPKWPGVVYLKAQTALVGKFLDEEAAQSTLGFADWDLTSVQFMSDNYKIVFIGSYNHTAVKVTASHDNAPDGGKTLNTNGSWQ